MTTEATYTDGAELRDHFAAAVMPQLLREMHEETGVYDIEAIQTASADAYIIADAMIKARGEKT